MPWRAAGDPNLPLADESREWDGAAAAARVFAWAGFDGDDPNPAKAARAHLAQNTDDANLRGSYKLGFADIIDGELTAVPRGLFACAGGRGVNSADLPDDVKMVIKRKLRAYYDRMDQEPPESIKSREQNMEIEYKSLPCFTKDIDGRTVIGIAAVHGNIDDGGDMSENGSFARGMASRRRRSRFLWNHNSEKPPIATIKFIQEVGRDALPETVLSYAPGATGGVEIGREYYTEAESDLANWVFSAVGRGDVDEMSYAYNIPKGGAERQERDGQSVRLLKEIIPWDFSDVLWGMNPATAGVKGFLESGLPFTQHGDAVVSTVAAFLERVKDRRDFRADQGRSLSDFNRKHLQSLAELLTAVQGDLGQILTETDPDKAARDMRRKQLDYALLRARSLRLRAQLEMNL